ncbi:cytochrome P450 [Scleroderma yunnanense]
MEFPVVQSLMPSIAAGIAGVILVGLWLATRKKNGRLPYPPGPKGLPVIGNALDLNMKEPHVTYAKWAEQYGDIVYSRIFNQDFVIINSTKIARHLADQRSMVYSDRPQSPLYKLFGIDQMTFLMKYCDEWRMHRKLFHLSLKADVVDQYQELYLRNTSLLLANLQRSPSKFREHLHLYTGSISLELIYGRRIEGKNDPIITLATELGDILSKETTPERSGLLMAFPLLQYFPAWFPGFGFKYDAKISRKTVRTLAELPYCMAKQQMESGILPQCLVYDFLTNSASLEEKSAKDAASGVYLASAESTAAILEMLILVMVLFPDVQEKAHAELDAVIGKGIIPTFNDRERLPYLQAVIYELMRWNPVFPLGVPHMTSTSDIYEGYYIPKGCIVIFNIWAMTRGHSDPKFFDPTRHLTPDGKILPQARQNNGVYFGFGRRVCPGRFFAENGLWAAIAMMLSSFTFERAKDANGNYIDIEPKFEHGQASHPSPFECSIIRR